MSAPRATLRLQFHASFTFAQATQLVPYFAALGVSHVYASPILTARKGSPHGYDVVDPTRINPELGGDEGLRTLVAALRAAGLGLIVDIVPNHMAVGPENAWWRDVLRHGQGSRYAPFFDIDWSTDDHALMGKVLLPILGRPYGEALAAGELRLARRRDDAGVALRYLETELPLAPVTVTEIERLGLSPFEPTTAEGRHQLHRLLERQHYRLAWWRVAGDEINWRRFFDINDLAALRAEDDDVFEQTHATIFRLYRDGLIDGVRVDHVDGLSHPGAYCRRLGHRLAELAKERPRTVPNGPAYLVVEKILGPGEDVPPDWGIDGTTGYDFMNQVSALLHHPGGEAKLTRLWRAISRRAAQFAPEEEAARHEIIDRSFSGQLNGVVAAFHRLARADIATRDISRAALRRCLVLLLAHFPVYRVYTAPGRCSDADAKTLARAFGPAREQASPGDHAVLDQLATWLHGRIGSPITEGLQRIALARFQQLSAPIAAKAVEDTAFYRYGRLLSRNDVGFDPACFAMTAADFHSCMQARRHAFPRAMLATATHDHKRGEDVRARLAVLSEIPDRWASAVGTWLAMSRDLCVKVGDSTVPLCRDLYVLFQTMAGAWPLELSPRNADGCASFARRLAQWQQKALREAKLSSDWIEPNLPYERAAEAFVEAVMSSRRGRPLRDSIAAFAQSIAPAGAVNSLAQTVLKLTAPGVPDLYQGSEYWDLSLVDPDNRRPVDFERRQATLGNMPLPDLASSWQDGRIKQAIIARLLATRREAAQLFDEGAYRPVDVAGALADHVVAYVRILEPEVAIVAVARHVAPLLDGGGITVPVSRWQDTRLDLPRGLSTHRLRNCLTDERHTVDGSSLPLGSLLRILPVCVLTSATPSGNA